MVNITLFEVHVDDAMASLSTGGSGSDGGADEPAVFAGEEAEDGDAGPPVAAAVVGLVFALAVALVVRKFVLGGSEESPEL